jgi:hypothetical protein
MQHAATRWGLIIITAGVLSTPAMAHAAAADEQHTKGRTPFGTKGTVSLLLERLASVSYHRITSAGVGGGDTLASENVEVSAFKPDVAFDGFVFDHLSLGLRADYEGFSTTYAHGDGAQTFHRVDLFPRAGFAWSFPSKLGVWAQASFGGSIGWFTQFFPTGSPMVTRSGSLSAGLAVLGTYTPAPHVVLTAGPWIYRQVYQSQPDDNLSSLGASAFRDRMPVGFSLGAGVYL